MQPGCEPLVLVQTEPFDVAAIFAQAQSRAGVAAGALSSFLGLVRDDGPGLAALHVEHYPGMTEAALRGIASDAVSRHRLAACTVIHRVGRLPTGAPIVLVVCAAAHRDDSLRAVAMVIDFLKTRAPLWKCEEFRDGRRHWVEARGSDEAAASAWDAPGRDEDAIRCTTT